LREGLDAGLLYHIPTKQDARVAMDIYPAAPPFVSDREKKGAFRVTLPEKEPPASMIALATQGHFPIDFTIKGSSAFQNFKTNARRTHQESQLD
jgi:hypothetical protein